MVTLNVVDPKPVWHSKINWAAAITAAIGIIQLAVDQEWTSADADKILLVVSSGLTIVLRTFFTSTTLTFNPEK